MLFDQSQIILEAGIQENAVDLAPIRVVSNAIELEAIFEKSKADILKN